MASCGESKGVPQEVEGSLMRQAGGVWVVGRDVLAAEAVSGPVIDMDGDVRPIPGGGPHPIDEIEGNAAVQCTEMEEEGVGGGRDLGQMLVEVDRIIADCGVDPGARGKQTGQPPAEAKTHAPHPPGRSGVGAQV